MAKLAVHLATVALILFLANASITTVTVDSEENPWGRSEGAGSCQQQIKQQDYVKHCQKYMEAKCCSSSNYNKAGKHLDSCCQQLEKLDRQCRCPGLRQAVTQQMPEGQMRREEMQKMHQMADKIMSECEMEPRSCDTQYRTTSITLDSEENTSCQQQIKKQNYLKHSQKYMEEKCSSSRENPSEHLDSCCKQLEKMDSQCRCPGLKQAMQQQMEEGQMGREEMQEMYQMADKIMSECEMEPRTCDTQYRTTSITLDSEENTSCQQQIKKQNYLKHCQKYMEEKCSSSRENPSEHLDSCCKQLEKMDSQCRCTGLKQAMQQQMEEGQMGREEMQEIYQMADKIMSKCEMEPRRCDMPSRGWL